MDNKQWKKNFRIFALASFAAALAIFVFTFRLYHYGTAELTFSDVWHAEPEKPFVTLLFGIWGTMFLFCSGASLMASFIFFNNKKNK